MYLKYHLRCMDVIMDIPNFTREYSFWYRHLIRTLEQENLFFVSKVVKSCLAVCCFPIIASKAWRKSKLKHLFCTIQQDNILTCPKPIVGTVLGHMFRIIRCLSYPAKTAVSPLSSPLETFREEKRPRLSDRNSILMT